MKYFSFLDADGNLAYGDVPHNDPLPDYALEQIPRKPRAREDWDKDKFVEDLAAIQAEAVEMVNAEAERRILADYPFSKQLNDIQDPLADGTAERIAAKDAVRSWSNDLNARIGSAKTGAAVAKILEEIREVSTEGE